MTKAEELDWIYRLRSNIYVYMPKEWLIPMDNALGAAIKALEQEPCEDATLKDIFCMGCEYKEQEPILDKIRAELHATAEMHEDGAYYLRDEWIDEYFDKYKGRK